MATRVETDLRQEPGAGRPRRQGARPQVAAARESKQQLTYKVLQPESQLLGAWVDEIDALPKPERHEQAANKFIADMRALGDLLAQTATAIKHNDSAHGKELGKQLAGKTDRGRGQVRSLNIEKCYR